ncbi:MAG: A24 family peptidase [Candidatus Diapherotrites archaeon]|nr:A24 family peptidase [Candidatus Diapherotrites archaeon]
MNLLIYFFLFLLSIFGLVYASYTDLKERIVPDHLSYFLIFAGLFLHLIMSLFFNNFIYLISSIAASILAFLIALIFWKLGFWAGGDVKLFTAIASLNPINYSMFSNFFPAKTFSFGYNLPIFPLSLFFFSILAMFPYAALITLSRFYKNNELRNLFFLSIKNNFSKVFIFSIFYTSLPIVLNFLGVSHLKSIILLIVFVFLLLTNIAKTKTFDLISIAIFLFSFIFQQTVLLDLFINFIILSLIFVFFELIFLSRNAMRKKIKIKDIKEGMIVSDLIVEKDGVIKKIDFPSTTSVLNKLKNNKLDEVLFFLGIGECPYGKVIATPKSAAGLTKEAVIKIKELAKHSGIDYITITESAPFVPAVLLGYLCLHFTGDILWDFLF